MKLRSIIMNLREYSYIYLFLEKLTRDKGMCAHLPFCKRSYFTKATFRGLAGLLTWCCPQLSLEQRSSSCCVTFRLEAHSPGGFLHYSQIYQQGCCTVLTEKAKSCLKSSSISHIFHFYFHFFPTQSLSLYRLLSLKPVLLRY